MSSDERWKKFFELTANKPPSALLVEALPQVKEKKNALDLGAGALKDTRYLLEQGFEKVTIVDSSSRTQEFASQLGDPRIECFTNTFFEFQYPVERYDLVNAEFALPFDSPSTFAQTFEKIKSSIKKHGIFTGQLFGEHDEWNTPGRSMTFQTKYEAYKLLEGLEILKFSEIEVDGKTADQKPKHWHYFNIIAKNHE